MESSETVLWRLKRAEDKIEALDREKAEMKEVNSLVEEVKSLRRTLIAFAFTTAGSAIVFAFTIFALIRPT